MVKRLVLVFRVVMIFHLFTASKESFQRHPIVLRIKPYIPSKDLNTVYYLALSSLACLISLHAPLHILQSSHTELLILKQSLLHLLEHANWSSIFLTVFAISYSLFSQIILPQFSDFLLEFFQEALSNLKLQPSQYPKREKIQDKTRWTDQSEVERLYNPHLWNPRGSHTKSKVVSGFLPTTFSVPHHPPPPALSSLPSLLIFFLDQLNFPGPHSTCLVHSGKILSTHC